MYICDRMENYKIKIKQFEGPFDLILFFIERDELDIYDIPIAQITKDFLEYIRVLEQLNIDVASEFILVAATLMRIKAKMLIPRKELDEEGNEIDPREELVQRLLEYQQFKGVIDDLKTLEADRTKMHQRGYAKVELKELASKALVDIELESITITKLFHAFNTAMTRFNDRNERVVHQIIKYPYTIETQRDHISKKFYNKSKVSFDEVFQFLEDRMEAIVTFLALLEMINNQVIRVVDGLGVNSFWIEQQEAPAEASSDQNKEEE